ncbi:hypothetical protein ACIQUZ_35610 [Streptomyces griseus]|uniref:hypothetical protein n=1 Tax=Streptomyces griseus TaxID=1911 RepID=UPI0038057895
MTQTVAQVRAALRRDTATLGRLQDKMAEVEARRSERIKLARQLGASGAQLAEDTSLSEGRISQIAPAKEAKRARAKAAPKRVAAPVREPLTEKEAPAPFRPGAVGAIKTTLSEYVSDAYARKFVERVTIFLDLESGEWCSPEAHRGRIEWRAHTAAEVLNQVPDVVERVYLVGPNRPGVRPGHPYDSEADAVRVWFLRDVPGWDVQKDGHFLADEDNPVGRWQKGEGERARAVEIARASGWFGEGLYTVAEAARAWWVLRKTIAGAFGESAILLSTPATTGRDLWRRTIGYTRDGAKKGYPVLSDELRQLIQSTSGQGRREIIPPAEGQSHAIPGFVQYDMRFAYAALAWGLPVGDPTMWTRRKLDQAPDDDVAKMLKGRGRWLVTATVPSNWNRVGLLGAPTAGGGWCYPSAPGQTFTTWASGGEVELARAMQWRVELREGFTFEEGKPLNTWRDKLTGAYQAAAAGDLPGPEVAHLVRAALRNLVLMTIGAFAARSHMVSHSMPATPENSDRLPTDRPVREIEGIYLWEEAGELSEWNRRLAHPEWSAEIWARCRLRLLNAPTGDREHSAGMLWVPADSVIGCRTDAVYLSTDPRWPDDGKPGRFRLKGKLEGSMQRPTTDAELDAMKTRAAANV